MCRLNMSHGDHKSHKAVVDLVKEYNKLNRHNVAIMLDTKGPEVRSGDVTEPIDMKAGSCSCTALTYAADAMTHDRFHVAISCRRCCALSQVV